MAVASDPLWTDYVAAFATLVGIVIAGVALVMAQRSAAEATRGAAASERTARAAEDMSRASVSTLEAASGQLGLARLEHERLEAERARQPIVEQIELSEVQPRVGEEAPSGIFRIGFRNSEDRLLTDAVLTILVDPGLDPLLTDRWGDARADGPEDDRRERWPGIVGDPRAFDCFTLRSDVPAGVSMVQYVCARHFGQFPLRVKLFSASLDGDGPWIDSWVDIDKTGTAKIVPLPSAAGRRYAGRCAEFEQLAPPDA